MLGNCFALGKLKRVNEFDVVPSEFLRPSFLFGVGVDGDDSRGTDQTSGVEDTEANATATEDSDGIVGWMQEIYLLRYCIRTLRG